MAAAAEHQTCGQQGQHTRFPSHGWRIERTKLNAWNTKRNPGRRVTVGDYSVTSLPTFQFGRSHDSQSASTDGLGGSSSARTPTPAIVPTTAARSKRTSALQPTHEAGDVRVGPRQQLAGLVSNAVVVRETRLAAANGGAHDALSRSKGRDHGKILSLLLQRSALLRWANEILDERPATRVAERFPRDARRVPMSRVGMSANRGKANPREIARLRTTGASSAYKRQRRNFKPPCNAITTRAIGQGLTRSI